MKHIFTINTFSILLATSLVCCMLFSQAEAAPITLIRDTEIESALRAYTTPILKSAHINPKDVNIFIIDSPEINAFVAGGKNIFIYTGLLRATSKADEIIGVLAHEIAHLYHHDLINGHINAQKSVIQSLLGVLLTLPVAIISGTPAPLLAGILMGNNLGNTTYLDASRTIEARADATAVRFLARNKMSPRGLLSLMEKLKKKEGNGPIVPFLQDHPLTKDRILYLQNALKNSPYKNNKLPPAFNKTQERIKAKLIGYQEPYNILESYYSAHDHSIPAEYARAIALMRIGRLSDALKIMQTLIKRSPHDPFFQELTGDILRQQKKLNEALIHYQKALNVIPWASLIHNRLAQTYLAMNQANLTSLAIEHLNTSRMYEPWTSETWFLLAQAYGRQKKLALSYYASAKYAFLNNNFQESATFASKAQKLLPKNSTQSTQMSDLLTTIENAQKYQSQ